MPSHLSLENQVIMALRRITRAIDLHSRDLLQDVGLTAPQLTALQAISRLQPVTVGALAKSIHLSHATLTGILSRLESRKLVSRSRSGSDRRAVVVELTKVGESTLETAPSMLQERFRSELHKLEEWEQTQMLATLQRIASMMDTQLSLSGTEDSFVPEDFESILRTSIASGEKTIVPANERTDDPTEYPGSTLATEPYDSSRNN